MALHHLIYLSRATEPLSDHDLQALLAQARQNNSARHITGVLVYGNGQFAQIIEGEERVLQELYDCLLLDPRHAQVTKFADKAIAQRSFGEWSMAFQAVSAQEMQGQPSYVSLAELDLEPAGLSATDTQLLHMMASFVLPTPAAHSIQVE
jgi:hypothetical protein